MEEIRQDTPPGMPRMVTPIARTWMRFSPRLVPFLAVITAFLFGIPLMIITGGDGNIGKGLNVSGVAYTALIEGAFGITINDVAGENDFGLIKQWAENNEIETGSLSRQARPFEKVGEIGMDQMREFSLFLAAHPGLDEDTINELGERILAMEEVGEDTIRAVGQTLILLDEAGLSRGDIGDLAGYMADKTVNAWDNAIAKWPDLNVIEQEHIPGILPHFDIILAYRAVTLTKHYEALLALDEIGIALNSDEARTLTAIFNANTSNIIEGQETLLMLEANNINDPAALGEDFRLVGSFYDLGYLTLDSVNEALETELPAALDTHLVIRRPGNNSNLTHEGKGGSLFGIVKDDQKLPVAYIHLLGKAFLFFPARLEWMLVRSIPFIIAGLAVALGFKGGLFNIGAEGQLYAGAIFAVTIGAFPILGTTNIFILPTMILLGILGGFLWGALPGVLKAFTGANEVITTIMLNYVAILMVDWLIKSDNPVILADLEASAPQTPYIHEAARLPTFNQFATIGSLVPLLALVVVFWCIVFYVRNRENLTRKVAINALRWIIFSIAFVVFLVLITVRDNLHVGIFLMLGAVWFVDWFLERTTLGFELRTVGTNPHAAKYAGMSIKRNIILAMALSGALAGLAGGIEVSGVQHNMRPAFFAGVGFDAIAVALLGRSNPKSILWAGLLWGGLLSGAGLMQVRADISLDLVRIIQALIIMFIAADQIIRILWRVPESSDEDAKISLAGSWGGE